MDLEPLSPSATPGTMKPFRTPQTRPNGTLMSLIYSNPLSHFGHSREASGIDSEFQWDEPEVPQTRIKSKFVCFLSCHTNISIYFSRLLGVGATK